jgi:hypothetical protein
MSAENFEIVQGKTFSRTIRYGKLPFIYKAINSISQSAPAQLNVPSHGLPDQWLAAIVSAKGMFQINAELGEDRQPKADQYNPVTVVDANTITVNAINSSDFSPHTTGGYLQAYTPVDLAGATARMTIRDAVGGSVLDTLTVAGGELTLDNTSKTITLKIGAAATAAYTWESGVYDLEFEDAAGNVEELLSGTITVKREVTT